jgi:hypothetical protein
MKTDKLERLFIMRADRVEARIDLAHSDLQAKRVVFPVGIVDRRSAEST